MLHILINKYNTTVWIERSAAVFAKHQASIVTEGLLKRIVTGDGKVTKYYYAGAQRVATLAPHGVWCSAGVRKYTIPQPMTVEYFLSDHLGSASITTDTSGAKVSETRYKPWGEIRYAWTSGQSMTPSYMLPSYTFTGQYSYMDDPTTTGTGEGFGLMFYNARMYDPVLGRFTGADTVVPGGVQGFDRYAYVNNSPVNFVDPSGHKCVGQQLECVDDIGTPINGSKEYKDDPVQLTIRGKRGNGQQMKDVYERLFTMCGSENDAWWNPDCFDLKLNIKTVFDYGDVI